MSNELETQIKDELQKDRITNFYKKNKIIIISIFLLVILSPLFFQFNSYYQNKNNQNFTSQFIKAEMLLQQDSETSLKILNYLKINANDSVRVLATSKLVEYYLDSENKKKALDEIKKSNYKYDSNIFNELKHIQEALLRFDEIKENELINLLKKSESDNFQIIKNQILYDYYTKNDQPQKAKIFQR